MLFLVFVNGSYFGESCAALMKLFIKGKKMASFFGYKHVFPSRVVLLVKSQGGHMCFFNKEMLP